MVKPGDARPNDTMQINVLDVTSDMFRTLLFVGYTIGILPYADKFARKSASLVSTWLASSIVQLKND